MKKKNRFIYKTTPKHFIWNNVVDDRKQHLGTTPLTTNNNQHQI